MSDKQKRIAKLVDGTETEIEAVIQVDPVSYEINNKYYIQGNECKKVTLDSKQAKNFAAYALIKKDLKFVIKSFKLAIDITKDGSVTSTASNGVSYRAEHDSDADILKALYISGVITYAKCFTKADGRRVKLEKNLFDKKNGKMKEAHLELMEQRHGYLAHGGKTNHEKVNSALVLSPISNKIPPTLITETYHTFAFSKNDFETFLSLAEYVDNKLNEILTMKSEALFKREIEPIPIEKWYE